MEQRQCPYCCAPNQATKQPTNGRFNQTKFVIGRLFYRYCVDTLYSYFTVTLPFIVKFYDIFPQSHLIHSILRQNSFMISSSWILIVPMTTTIERRIS